MFRKILAYIVLILMISAAVTAGTYRWQENRYNKILEEESAVSKQKIELLENHINRITGNAGILSGRQEDGTQLSGTGLCLPLNAADPNGMVEYRNEARGIVVELPYNANWGFGLKMPEGYLELSGVDGILFGRPQTMEQCRWSHTGQLTFLPPRSPEDIKKSIATRLDITSDELIDMIITERSEGDHLYYSYQLPGFCLMQNFELVGERYNYIFSSCAEYSSDLLEMLESVELL